jgi:hypothetical protein
MGSLPGLPGDFNKNGVVDAADYVVWRKTDTTQPGYNNWRTNFGRTSAAASSSAVPEPTGWLLLIVGAALATVVRAWR